MSEWQPIETALKSDDSDWVMLYVPSSDQGQIVAKWNAYATSEAQMATGETGCFEAPLSDGFYRPVVDYVGYPAHWMTLPSPPKVAP